MFLDLEFYNWLIMIPYLAYQPFDPTLNIDTEDWLVWANYICELKKSLNKKLSTKL